MADKFIIILFTVIGLTLVCGSAGFFVAIIAPDPPSPMLLNFHNVCMTLFQTGAGAVIALIGTQGIRERTRT